MWHSGAQHHGVSECSEFIATLRSFIGKTTDFGETRPVTQIGLARASDSVLHTEIAEAMQKRGVLMPAIGVYIEESGAQNQSTPELGSDKERRSARCDFGGYRKRCTASGNRNGSGLDTGY